MWHFTFTVQVPKRLQRNRGPCMRELFISSDPSRSVYSSSAVLRLCFVVNDVNAVRSDLMSETHKDDICHIPYSSITHKTSSEPFRVTVVDLLRSIFLTSIPGTFLRTRMCVDAALCFLRHSEQIVQCACFALCHSGEKSHECDVPSMCAKCNALLLKTRETTQAHIRHLAALYTHLRGTACRDHCVFVYRVLAAISALMHRALARRAQFFSFFMKQKSPSAENYALRYLHDENQISISPLLSGRIPIHACDDMKSGEI